VRDGLKPVHRRILHAMHELRLDPGSGYKKCARVVGDVIGKFHPHGELAGVRALVRLAQDFAQRYPLVDGQGNFGNIDGDNAAAMRYTESRLSSVAGAMLEGIDEDAVDFRTTYDGEDREPVVLPGRFPNLLANGAAGSRSAWRPASRRTTPANYAARCLHLIDSPQCPTAELVRHVAGPDFPTGGVLVEPPESITEAYATGPRQLSACGRAGTRSRCRTGLVPDHRDRDPVSGAEEPPGREDRGAARREELPLLADVRDESASENSPRPRTEEP
jgi:topoisomerase-4 subunit A